MLRLTFSPRGLALAASCLLSVSAGFADPVPATPRRTPTAVSRPRPQASTRAVRIAARRCFALGTLAEVHRCFATLVHGAPRRTIQGLMNHYMVWLVAQQQAAHAENERSEQGLRELIRTLGTHGTPESTPTILPRPEILTVPSGRGWVAARAYR